MNGATQVLQTEAIAHLASFVLYIANLVLIIQISRLLKCVQSESLRKMLSFFLSVTVVMCLTFMAVQSLWVVNYGFEPMVTLEAIGWLIFDWLNGLAYLSFVLSIRLAILWKPSCETCIARHSCPKRHSSCFAISQQQVGECHH